MKFATVVIYACILVQSASAAEDPGPCSVVGGCSPQSEADSNILMQTRARVGTHIITDATSSRQEAAASLKKCSELEAADIPNALEVRTVKLQKAILKGTRHSYYAGTRFGGFHALLYSDFMGRARLMLYVNETLLVTKASKDFTATALWGKSVGLGVEFDPKGENLVVLLKPSIIKKLKLPDRKRIHRIILKHRKNGKDPEKLKIPDLEELWSRKLKSRGVKLTGWRETPKNSYNLGVSSTKYVLHTAGKRGKHQGGYLQFANAKNGKQEGGCNWLVSHDVKQMIGYNPDSDTFLLADAGDFWPKGLLFSVLHPKGYCNTNKRKVKFSGWGDKVGRQGVSEGRIAPAKKGGGFGAVWSFGLGKKGTSAKKRDKCKKKDKIYFAALSKWGKFTIKPRKIFPDCNKTEIGGNLIALGEKRWLLAYAESNKDSIKDYMKILQNKDWGVKNRLRTRGSRLAILNEKGEVVDGPVNIAKLGAHFNIEINHLVELQDGVGWVYMTEWFRRDLSVPGRVTTFRETNATFSKLKCIH